MDMLPQILCTQSYIYKSALCCMEASSDCWAWLVHIHSGRCLWKMVGFSTNRVGFFSM